MVIKSVPSAPIDFGSIMAKKAVLLPVPYCTNRRYSLLRLCVKRKFIMSCATYILPFLFISKISQAMWIAEIQKNVTN
jgi:hypothetical protein